jgi:hypothetical protein
MIIPKLLLVADTVITDRESNNVSVINILEEITPIGLPLLIPKVSVLSIFDREETDPEEFASTFRLTMGDMNIFTQEIPANFNGMLKFRQSLIIGGLFINRPGIIDKTTDKRPDGYANYLLIFLLYSKNSFS